MRKILAICFIAIAFANARAQEMLGKINFKAEGADVSQPYFQKGLLLLHSFEYADAAEQFDMAQLLDPNFVMAYWGEAMCYNHPVSQTQDYKKGKAALLKLGISMADREAIAKNDVEKGLLHAVELLYQEDKSQQEREDAYVDAMKALYEKNPSNSEVASFYALALLGSSGGNGDAKLQDQVTAICKDVLKSSPDHPGALHYLILANAGPDRAYKALEAADRYQKVAASSEKALHAASRVYCAMGMWDKMVKANELSWNAAEKKVQKKKLSLEDRAYSSLWWLEYGYLQQGKYQKCVPIVQDMYRDARLSNSVKTRYYLMMMKAAYLAETGNWNHSIIKIEIPTNEFNLVPKVVDLFLKGMNAYTMKDGSKMEWIIRQINDQRNIEQNSTDPSGTGAGNEFTKPADENDLKQAEVMELELRALLALTKGENDQALTQVEKAAQLEESVPVTAGPPAIVKPANELYGEILMQLGQADKSLAKFDLALKNAPNRTRSLIGKYHAYKKMNDNANAAKVKQLILQNWKEADAGLAGEL